jgi:hypothetical protein
VHIGQAIYIKKHHAIFLAFILINTGVLFKLQHKLQWYMQGSEDFYGNQASVSSSLWSAPSVKAV